MHSCQTKWVQWLHLAEFWYNTSYHTSLKKSPFEVLYGHQPRYFGIDIVESCAIPQLDEWLKERDTMTKLLQHHLERVQQRMKNQADKGRTERSFEEGGSSSIKEVLVRWTGMTDSLVTWENLQDLRQRFPKAPAWGQAGFQEMGNVTDLQASTPSRVRKEAEKLIQASGTPEEREALRRSRRARKKAARLAGPEWTA